MAESTPRFGRYSSPDTATDHAEHRQDIERKAVSNPESAPQRPMITEQELLALAERDFGSPEDIKRLAEQRRTDFDKEWNIAPDAEDDFSPMTR